MWEEAGGVTRWVALHADWHVQSKQLTHNSEIANDKYRIYFLCSSAAVIKPTAYDIKAKDY
jgi:hypothetical protein